MIKLVQSGKEPVISGAVAWLEAHGIPVTLIQAISLDARVGDVARITVTMIVDEPDKLVIKDNIQADQDDLGHSAEDRAPRTEREFRQACAPLLREIPESERVWRPIDFWAP